MRSDSGGGGTGSGDFYHDAAAGVELDQTRCPKKGIKVNGV